VNGSDPKSGEEYSMFDIILASAVSMGLLGYLLYALLKPEKF
jgi:K+-transporting ATPase KdpF subunit